MYSELKCLCAAIKCIGSDMQDLEAKCCGFIFSLKVKHEQQTTGNRRQKLCIWSHFYHQGNLWHPIHVHCLMALTVFRLGRLHSGCVFCCKRSFVLFVFLITCSTCISNHKANQWLKSIHTLRGCNKCWISVLLKRKATSTLHFFQTQHI